MDQGPIEIRQVVEYASLLAFFIAENFQPRSLHQIALIRYALTIQFNH